MRYRPARPGPASAKEPEAQCRRARGHRANARRRGAARQLDLCRRRWRAGGGHQAGGLSMPVVFVYGTLRAGEVNDLNAAARKHGIAAPRLIGGATVAGRLYDFGTYPGLVLDAAAPGVVG